MPVSRFASFLVLFIVATAWAQADPLEQLAPKAPLLTRALRSDAEIRGLLTQEGGQKALNRILALAGSKNPDVQEALEIICRPLPKPGKAKTIRVDGNADDWAGMAGAEIPEPSAAVREHGGGIEFFSAYADAKTLYLIVRMERGDFLSTGGNRIGFDIDLIEHPANDCRITIVGGTLAVTKQAHPVADNPPRDIGDRAIVGWGDVLEMGIPISILSEGREVKPLISVCAFASVESSRQVRHATDYVFPPFPAAAPEHYCQAYARSLFYLCLDCDVGKDDVTAIALSISRAIYGYVGDDEVRRQARTDAAEVYRIAREIIAWQKERAAKVTLADYPLEAQLTWAMQGAERAGVNCFPMFRAGKRPTLEEYLWVSLRPENLRRLRKMAEENQLVDPDVSVTAEKTDKWARAVQHYRVGLDEMKRRADCGILKKETYEEAVRDAKEGIDICLKLGGKDIFYGTMNSGNAVLTLYDKTGNFYGNCSDHTMLCSAMYSALGIASLRLFREPSRQRAVNHVWPGYYDPAERRWKSPQKGETHPSSCDYFKMGSYPVYLDSYCLPMIQLRANDPAQLREYGIDEVTRQHLTERLKRGFDEAAVRERIFTPLRRLVLPKATAPEPRVVAPEKSAIRVGVFADEKASQRSVREAIEALSSTCDITPTWFLAEDVGEKLCDNLDVFIFPGGSSRQAETLGKAGCERIKRAVQGGKGYVGLSAGGYMAAISWNWCEPIKMIAARTDTKYWDRGTGIVQIETASAARQPMWLFYVNGPVFSPAAVGGLGESVVLAKYVSEFRDNKAPEGTMQGEGGIVAGAFGKGRVVLFGPDPEQTPGMEHLLVEAVRWAAGKGDRGKKITWEGAFGQEAVQPRPIRPTIRLEPGNAKEWKGVAVGAPRASPDWHTGDVALALTERRGVPSVSAYGMQSMFNGRSFDVSAPSERPYSYWQLAERRSYSPDAQKVYDTYQKALFDVGETKGGPLDLYVEVRGHSLKVEPKEGEKSTKTIYREVVEARAMGFADEEVRKLKDVYARFVEKDAPQVKAPIYFWNLPEDRTYDVEGYKVEFDYSTSEIEETGAMRPACARRTLLLVLPRVARFEGTERRKYGDVIAGLLAEAAKMARTDFTDRPPDNLVRNGGMERDIETDWFKRTPNDDKRQLTRTEDAAHSGQWSLKIANTSDTLSRWRQGSDGSIRVKPGSILSLMGWVKSNIPEKGAAFLTLFIFSEGNEILSVTSTRLICGAHDWTLCRQEIEAPTAATHCAVYLEIRGKGEAWFDDITLDEVVQAEKKEKDILLLTDLPVDDPMRKNIAALCEGRIVAASPSKFSSQSAEKTSALVIMRGGIKDSGLTYSALDAFARKGGTVVMDLGNYAEAAGLKAARTAVVSLPQAQTTFSGTTGSHRIYVYCVDDVRSNSTLYLAIGDRVVGRWDLDAPARTKDEETTPRVFATIPMEIKKGDLIRLAASPAGHERCAVDRIEIAPPTGKPVVIEVEEMQLSGYRISTKIAPFAKGVKTRRSAVAERHIQIQVENDVTRGFHAGDRAPWFGGEFSQSPDVKETKKVRTLATEEDGGATLVEEKVGKGRIVAMDLLGMGEPMRGRPGTYNKYVFLSNVIGRGVMWGEFAPKRLSYSEFVEEMRTLADTYQAVDLKEEGAASGGYKIYSLNLGDSRKPKFLVYAATHGTEWEPAYGLLALAKRIAASPSACGLDLDRYAFKFIPILNPWGYENESRKNANGVDINRNSSYCWETYTSKELGKGADEYDDSSWKWKGAAPFSEPESQTYKKIVESNDIYCLIDLHCTAHFVSLPTTARVDNDAKVAALRRIFRREFAGRYIAEVPEVPGIGQYGLGRMTWMGDAPFLLQYGAKDRYGVLLELPGCYSGTYGTVMQTDVAATACMAAIEAYGGLRRE
ncbi:MAG: M14 family zinc carboxypeptidase [Planctomycetota bacterium]